MRIILSSTFICLHFMGKTQTETFAVESNYVNDSFDITVTYNGKNSFSSIVYYLDADRYSGKMLRERIYKSNPYQNILFVGIANRGRNHQYRRRDYIPPIIKNGVIIQSNKKDHGHADVFYNFLKLELVPLIENKYNTPGKRTLVGHSYSGLFVVYSLLKNDALFDQYIALSPALWVSNFNIFKYENELFKKRKDLKAYLYLSGGKKEWFNLILIGNRKLRNRLIKRNYKGLELDYEEHPKTNHFSQLPLSFEYLFSNQKF